MTCPAVPPLKRILEFGRPHWDRPETRPAVRQAFGRVLDCGTAALGAEVFASANEERVVYHTCKSRACPSCGYRATTLWQRDQWRELPDIPYAHVSLTMPDVLWPIFRRNRHLLHDLPVLGAQILQQWARRKYGVRLMIMVIPHTFGRHLNFNCHLHVLVSEGGLKDDGTGKWRKQAPLNRKALMRMWRYAVVTYLREAYRMGFLDTDLTSPQLKALLRQHYERWWNIHIQRFRRKKQFHGIRGPVCPAAPDRTASVPAYRSSPNPLPDQRHADETNGHDPLHDGRLPGRAGRSRSRPLPAQHPLLRTAVPTQQGPNARHRVRAAGARTARQAVAPELGGFDQEELRRRPTP